MGDTNKITKSITLDPETVEWVNQKIDDNGSDFTKEIQKSINIRRANMENKVYKYSDELEAIPISSLKGRSQGFWAREAAIGINRLLEYFKEKDLQEVKS